MKNPPIVKDLVLIGGGHSHVEVLRRFGMSPLPGVRLTMICRDVQTPYSGMLPGFVAGHYTFEEAHIDLRPLSIFAGARFYLDEVTGLDLANQKILCRGRPPVSFDLASINIGSAPVTRSIPGAGEHALPVKPIHRFLAHWERMRERVLDRPKATRIGVVGGGAGGVELLLSVQHRLQTLLAERARDSTHLEFHLVTDQDDILTTHNRRAAAKFRRVLAKRGVLVHTGFAVQSVAAGRLFGPGGAALDLDEILWVTQAGAARWIAETGLTVDARGFIQVDAALQSVSHPAVFAAGDIAAVADHPRPKSGVFAVRQGPPLADNLRRALLGKPSKAFRPQRHFLSLISTGNQYAVASRSWWAAEGRLIWRWKDWIDRRFMDRYADLPAMKPERHIELPGRMGGAELTAAATAMRCGGCGAKVGADLLTRALSQLEPVRRPEVLIGLHEGDDAAAVEVPPGKVMVHSVDGFRAIVDDPYLFGKIAANHALGDIFAMGAEPQTALAIASLPYGIEAKVEDTLRQMMAGAVEVLNEAETALVGGHTSEGAEMFLGFAVNGIIDRGRLLRKGGMRPGEKLIITKALGTGALFAADMRHQARGRWIVAAIESMLLSNRDAANVLLAAGATACTDITGFGLLGHLLEMIKPSAVDVVLELPAIPLLDGAMETVRRGITSSLQPQNLRLRRAIANPDRFADDPRLALLFDPQTAGGLIATVAADRAEACVAELKLRGYPLSAIIGTVNPRCDELQPVTLFQE